MRNRNTTPLGMVTDLTRIRLTISNFVMV